ncbi:MAG: aldehyde dehydrogenase family protein [Synergistaceae bacterium]|jgi:betaine-aldehyde dehydrogenase|nr:aldehyde dehydrogenase family protein [Synergistaceae bacterium]
MSEVKKMFVGGKWVEALDKGVREIINPCDGSVLSRVADGGAEDAKRAISIARETFDVGEWSGMPGPDRAKLLWAFADEMTTHVDELAKIETQNTGKALIESEYDVYDSAACFRYYAGLINKPGGQSYNVHDPAVHSISVREPIGVCGLISAWNFPMSLAAWKLAPALAAGNTLVFKPASLTPLSNLFMFELFEKVAFPAGVVNIVTGSGDAVGQTIAESLDVDKVAFTGSVSVGRKVMTAAASNIKGVTLELGGKSPNVIFADADFAAAVDYGLFGAFYNQGEVCTASTRLLVEEPIYDKYLAALVEKTKKIKIGNGLDKGVKMGPLISEAHMKTVLEYIEKGKAEGAKIACGGNRITKPGYEKGFFIEPTIFTETRPDMAIVQEEIFGPVLVLQKFNGEEEAVRLANDTIYGLAAAVFSNDISKAIRVVRQIRAGITWINTYGPVYNEAPWGGYKQSGLGRELGTYGLDDYTEVKQININTAVAPTGWFDAE